MKFVLTWVVRANGTLAENIESTESAQRLLANWQPNPQATIREWVTRCDNNGGFCVLETNDLPALHKDLATWTPWLAFQVFPVLDIQESTPLVNEAAAIARSGV